MSRITPAGTAPADGRGGRDDGSATSEDSAHRSLRILLGLVDIRRSEAHIRLLRAAGHDLAITIGAHPFLDALMRLDHDILIIDAGAASILSAAGTAVRAGHHNGPVFAISSSPLRVKRLPKWSEFRRDDPTALVTAVQILADTLGSGQRRSFGRYLLLDSESAIVVDERIVQLSRREFDMAAALFRAEGDTLSRDDLLKRVWGASPEMVTRTVDVHACRLRDKLGLRGEHGAVLTAIYGRGYRIGFGEAL